jgi:hypothetical protein
MPTEDRKTSDSRRLWRTFESRTRKGAIAPRLITTENIWQKLWNTYNLEHLCGRFCFKVAPINLLSRNFEWKDQMMKAPWSKRLSNWTSDYSFGNRKRIMIHTSTLACSNLPSNKLLLASQLHWMKSRDPARRDDNGLISEKFKFLL